MSPDERFTAACTRCNDCVKICPEQVLYAGDGGFPQIDFSRRGCSLCGACLQACKSGALCHGGAPAFTWRARITTGCLAERGVECRICGDSCEARALRFVPSLGGISKPQLDLQACTGCGECLSSCPVRAIEMMHA